MGLSKPAPHQPYTVPPTEADRQRVAQVKGGNKWVIWRVRCRRPDDKKGAMLTSACDVGDVWLPDDFSQSLARRFAYQKFKKEIDAALAANGPGSWSIHARRRVTRS